VNKISLVIILLSFIKLTTFAQEADIISKDAAYQFKKNQHTITYSPIAFVGYKYAHSFNKNLTFGVGVSLGISAFSFPPLFELAKVNIFYRKFISETTYLNLGFFAALEFEFQPFRGFEGEVFYGWDRFKIGQGIQLGYFDDQMSDYGGEKFVFSINLLILQVNL